MKKLNIMLEDELLTARSDPVPRGRQKQILIARTLCIVVAWFLAPVSPCQASVVYPDYPISATFTDSANLGVLVTSFKNTTGGTVNDLWIFGYIFPGNPPVNPMVPGPGTEYTFTAIGPGASYAPGNGGNGGNGFQILSQAAYVAEGQFDLSKITVYGYWTFNGVYVPEPSTMIAGALLLLPFGASTLRMLRKTRTV